jgi:hypothetical protein
VLDTPNVLVPSIFRDILKLIFCHVPAIRQYCVQLRSSSSYNACQIPILLVKNLVVVSALSSGMPSARPTSDFNAGRGMGHNKAFPTMLKPLGSPGIRKKELNLTPLGLLAR